MDRRRPQRCHCCNEYDDVALPCQGCQKIVCSACLAEHGITEMHCRIPRWRCTHRMTRFLPKPFSAGRHHDY